MGGWREEASQTIKFLVNEMKTLIKAGFKILLLNLFHEFFIAKVGE
jgi:hypothetical protein